MTKFLLWRYNIIGLHSVAQFPTELHEKSRKSMEETNFTSLKHKAILLINFLWGKENKSLIKAFTGQDLILTLYP